MRVSFSMLLPLALSLTACAAPSVLSPVRIFDAGEARLLGVTPDQSRVLVSVQDRRKAGYGLQAGGTDTVRLTLSNAAKGINPGKTEPRFVKEFTLSEQVFTAFSGLRPEEGYELGVEWRDGSTVMGTGRAAEITLTAGKTAMVNVVVNEQGAIALSASDVGNPLADKLVILGDTVRFGTGFSGVSAGAVALVKTFKVTLGGELFADGQPRVLTKPVTQLSDFSQFEWRTAVADLSPTWGAGAASMVYADLSAPVNTTLTFQLLDGSGKLIGESAIAIQVVSGAELDLQLHLPSL